MAIYNVLLMARATVAQPEESVTVSYECDNYQDAWVGARTTARMGSKAPLRVFRHIEDGVAFKDRREWTCPAGVYVVRHIFVEGTRKTGKRRMTTLTPEQLIAAIKDRDIRISGRLEQTLMDVLKESDGLKVTVATARKLGLLDPEGEPQTDEDRLAG